MTTTINASTSSGLVVTPDNSGNVLLQYNGVAAPAFSAYQSSGTALVSGTTTKVLFDTEEYDTANCFSSSRFTPTVAGYYQINTSVVAVWAAGESNINLYKNGANYKNLLDIPGAYSYTLNGSCLVYLNGTTDYVEIYSYTQNGVTTIAGQNRTWFNGCLLRGA